MSDFQVHDIVETNESAIGEPRITTLVGDAPPTGKDRYFQAGERATVLTVQYEQGKQFLVYVRFSDGSEDNMYAGWLDLVYRPMDDLALYDRSLLDLVDGHS